jgi:hypothetical protein
MELEFKSAIKMEVGQCFRIISHDGSRDYPTRFKVLEVSDTPTFAGHMVEIKTVDLNVEPF